MNYIYHSNLTVGYVSASPVWITQSRIEGSLIALVGLALFRVNGKYRVDKIGRRQTEHKIAVL